MAWIIPEKIKWEQKYNSLYDVYRSMEYGAAIQAIVNFFVFDCSKDVSKIYSSAETFLSNIMKVFHFGFLHLLCLSSGE